MDIFFKKSTGIVGFSKGIASPKSFAMRYIKIIKVFSKLNET
jgi:hypothetical protein